MKKIGLKGNHPTEAYLFTVGVLDTKFEAQNGVKAFTIKDKNDLHVIYIVDAFENMSESIENYKHYKELMNNNITNILYLYTQNFEEAKLIVKEIYNYRKENEIIEKPIW